MSGRKSKRDRRTHDNEFHITPETRAELERALNVEMKPGAAPQIDPFTGRTLPFKTEIMGLPVTVASDEECERATLRICSPVRCFPDDVVAHCEAVGCGRAIYLRPHGPTNMPKVCLECGLKMMDEEEN